MITKDDIIEVGYVSKTHGLSGNLEVVITVDWLDELGVDFIFIDIDKFKNINDTYGHQCGDEVLKTVASTIRQLLRKYDFVARWGGEEFLAVLPETEIHGAKIVAERFRQSIESLHIKYTDIEIPVTVTLGVSQFDGELGIDKSIQLADEALYDGKMNGRNQVVVAATQNK